MSASAQIKWDDEQQNVPQIKWDDEPAKAAATAPAKPSEPGTWEKLTRPYNPDAAKLNPALRFLDAAGGAVMAMPQATLNTVLHPLDTAADVVKSLNAYNPAARESNRLLGMPTVTPESALSVLPEALGQGVGSVAAGESIGKIPSVGMASAKPALTRILRGPGGYGEIKSPIGKFPGLTRELEAHIPRNEPPEARGEMYNDLATRRVQRGNEQEALDQAHATRLGEVERERQKELAGWERLREQDARARMARQTEQDRITQMPKAEHAPLRPVVGTPEAWNAYDQIMHGILEPEAKTSGMYHAARGASGRALNLQQRMAGRIPTRIEPVEYPGPRESMTQSDIDAYLGPKAGKLKVASD